MRKNTLQEKIARKQQVFGLFVSIPHPIVIEMIGHANYDFVIIDLEHTATSMESVEEMIRAAELVGITPLVRIAKVERTEILKVLDCGAQGIVIPHVETLSQVKEAVHHAYYHPLGMRSLNSGRPGVFGKFPLTEYITEANSQVMIVPMIESVKGVRQSSEILSHPQVSFVLEGRGGLITITWCALADQPPGCERSIRRIVRERATIRRTLCNSHKRHRRYGGMA